MIHGRQRGLRIKLHIDPEYPSLAQLASLPWEFLYRKETRDFLNLSRFTPIIRYLDVQRPHTPLPLEPPLHILVVISAPTDYARLDLGRERALIEASWAKQEGVQVEFMERATILELQDRLGEQPCHVLHYMGHGDFDARTGHGALVYEDEHGDGVMVDGSTLGVLLRDVPTIRLVFLNACETAKVTREKGLDPFAGVAAAVVMAGIPAVVAMQFPISDSAAVTFAQRFYPLLARGYPVDTAVAEGRRAICLARTGTMEWGTPVLFLRAPQGVIFRVSESQRVELPIPESPEAQPEVDEALEQRLEGLYTGGLSAFWLEDWEKARQYFQAIVDLRPDYQDATAKLEEAQRQMNLATLYHQAQAAQEAEDWGGARSALEELVAEAPDFEDAADMLEVVRKQKRTADLYAEARQLSQAQQWQAVLNVFAQIQAIVPDYPDPENLLPYAEREVAALKRLAQLDDLYSRAVREMNAGRWEEARQLLAQMQEMEPGSREAERLLARAEAEISRKEAERQQQDQIATLYDQAQGLARARQWKQALAVMEEIQKLDPQYPDPEGIAAMVLEELERREEERQRQNESAALYAEAVQLLQARQYQEALQKWDAVQIRDPQYPDRQKVQATAKKKLAGLGEAPVLNRVFATLEQRTRKSLTGLLEFAPWLSARLLLAIMLVALVASVTVLIAFLTLFPGLAPGGTVLFISGRDGKREVYGITRTGELVQITHTPDTGESWSPASEDVSGTVLFTSNRDGKREIYGITRTGEVVQITHTPGTGESWSPASEDASGTVLFASNRDGKREVYGITRTGEVVQITHTPGTGESWSPASEDASGTVLFTSNRDGKREVYGITRTGEVVQITHTPGTGESWSPASDASGTVLFTSNRDGKREVYGITRTGEMVQITHTPDAGESWSPASDASGTVLFTSNRDGKREVYGITRTGEVVQITHTPDTGESWLSPSD
jgi:Tol biopolymer transport system component/outer membrane protein assembly factor BamD (BamD/ComL family)